MALGRRSFIGRLVGALAVAHVPLPAFLSTTPVTPAPAAVFTPRYYSASIPEYAEDVTLVPGPDSAMYALVRTDLAAAATAMRRQLDEYIYLGKVPDSWKAPDGRQ